MTPKLCIWNLPTTESQLKQVPFEHRMSSILKDWQWSPTTLSIAPQIAYDFSVEAWCDANLGPRYDGVLLPDTAWMGVEDTFTFMVIFAFRTDAMMLHFKLRWLGE